MTTAGIHERKPLLRVNARIAPLLALLVVGLVGVRVWIGSAYGLTGINDGSVIDSVFIILAFAPYLVVGLLLVLRRPDHRLGWVLTAIGVLTSVGALAEAYALLALSVAPDAGLPGGVFAAWIHNWYWFPLLILIFLFVPLLFPTGRPLSPRWRWLYLAALVLLLVVTLLAWVNPVLSEGSRDDSAYVVDNPIGIAAARDLENSTHGDILFLAILVLAVCAMVSLVIRFRRSRGIERQQMKLFVFAGTLMVLLPIGEELGLERFLPETNIIFSVAVALPPIAIGIAVLRYRLYDIDRLISRTVSYILVTAVLLALYLAVVSGITAVAAPAAGDSPIAVAAATLLAAAAFGPVRRRIQSAVDRRFNRAQYDAALTVETYRSALRDEVDLTALRTGLLGTVQQTMEPARSVLWLREPPAEVSR